MTALDLTGVESSYRKENYGELFYSLTRVAKPAVTVELGTYHGYSALHMAAGMRDNAGAKRALHLVDLWDKYQYRHCSLENTRRNFIRNDLLKSDRLSVEFHNSDAAAAAKGFDDDSIDLLHIDISNDGAKMAEIVPLWERKLKKSPEALLLMEGGSASRDKIEWMVKFRKPPLRAWIESAWVAQRFSAFTLEPYPSLTLFRRKP